MLFRSVGNNRVGSIAYRHGDSDGEGCRGIALFRYTYDQRGTLVREVQVRHFLCGTEKMGPANEITIGYRYSPTGDTLRTITEVPTPGQPHSYTHINVDRWERNARGQVDRQYVLNAIRDCRGGVITTDTNTNYSRRFAYDSAGKLIRVWYEYIYLGKFYHLSTGRPDTTYIRYDAANRRTHEVMRYTTDLRNKREPDMTGLSTLQKQDAAQAKLRFLNGNSGSDGNYTATIRHSYEPYDPVKHRPLNVPRWSSSWIH